MCRNQHTLLVVLSVLYLTMLLSTVISTAESRLRIRTPGGGKINVAVVTGGHEFDQSAFLAMFKDDREIQFTHLPQADQSEVFEDVSRWPYDVIVLYNLTEKISTKRRENFLRLLEGGVGVLSLHHASGAFQEWEEFPKIIGCRYFLAAMEMNGSRHEPSTYRHDVEIAVHVSDSTHPVSRGIKDFTVHDETYKNCEFQPDNRILLTTMEPSSDQPLGWVRTYRRANICHIQLGHGASIFADRNYRELVWQAIRWCAEQRVSESRREGSRTGREE